MCTLCFFVCFGCLAVEVIAVARLAWQRAMQQRTINAAAVCMSTSMCAVVNLRAPQRDSSFLDSGASARGHVEEHSVWAGAGGSHTPWPIRGPCGSAPGFGVNLALIDHRIEPHWINGMHLEGLKCCAQSGERPARDTEELLTSTQH